MTVTLAIRNFHSVVYVITVNPQTITAFGWGYTDFDFPKL